jgi:hypothetical protein
MGTHLGVWGFIPSLSHTPGNMKCDSWSSPLARTFASPCLGCEPKAKVARPIIIIHPIFQIIVIDYTFLPPLFSFFFQLLLLKQIFNKEYLIIKSDSLLFTCFQALLHRCRLKSNATMSSIEQIA